MPIRTMAGPCTDVVLSGDPQQLEPIIRSKIAIDPGLGQSYLERLMCWDVYDLESQYYLGSAILLSANPS